MRTEEEKQVIVDRVARRAGDYEEALISCAQGTLLALQEEFQLGGGNDLLLAASFMPGVGSRKETCGAFLGALMALGLMFGRVNPFDSTGSNTGTRATYAERKKRTAWRFCEELKVELGSTQCKAIHAGLMGREYDFMDPESFNEFVRDGGTIACRIPPQKAARIAATIILEELDRQLDSSYDGET